jgi:hypothetical protein
MDHVGCDLGGPPRDMRNRGTIAQPNLPAHRDAAHAKRKLARKRGEGGLGLRATSRGVRNEADPMPARRLSARKIDHMAKQPAHRRPEYMQDVE